MAFAWHAALLVGPLQSAHLFQVEIFRLATVGHFRHEFVGHHNAAVRLVELLKALGMDFLFL